MTTHTAFDFTPLLKYRRAASDLLARLEGGDAIAVTEGRALLDEVTGHYTAAWATLRDMGEGCDIRTADGLADVMDHLAGVIPMSLALDVAQAYAAPCDDTPAGLRRLHDLAAPAEDARMAALIAAMRAKQNA
jgi:hypothetical protein